METKKIKVLLTGGGTGGHIYPAIVIADEIRRLLPDAEIMFVGTERGLESKVVPRQGYDIKFVDVRYFARSFSPSNLVTAYKALTSVFAARKIIKRFGPDVVVGTGGYVSGPVVLAASQLKIPTLIHEQNAFPGLTTRLLAKRVTKVAVSHAEAAKHIKSAASIVVTGHPVRREFYQSSRDDAREQLGLPQDDRLVVVVGGSGGAEKINQTAVVAAPTILEQPRVQFMHITGSKYFNSIRQERGRLQLDEQMAERYQLVDYHHDMPLVMSACDLIVSRSGGMVHEITASGCPSILIPSPNVTDDHQLHNARSMAAAGAGVVVQEHELTSERLGNEVIKLLKDKDRLANMVNSAKKLGRPEAGNLLAKIISRLIKKGDNSIPWG